MYRPNAVSLWCTLFEPLPRIKPRHDLAASHSTISRKAYRYFIFDFTVSYDALAMQAKEKRRQIPAVSMTPLMNSLNL
jgi:hypothetical protein